MWSPCRSSAVHMVPLLLCAQRTLDKQTSTGVRLVLLGALDSLPGSFSSRL